MFTTDADFDAMPYNIPSDSVDAPEALASFINRTEQEILRKLLGSVLYNEFITAIFVDITADPLVAKDDADIDQKWLDLRDGAEYEIEGLTDCTFRYDGIINFMVPYVYSEWLAANHDHLTAMGNSLASVENAQMISPAKRIVKAYNTFSRYIGNCHCPKDTFWGFLDAKKLVYLNWRFKDPGKLTEFNI
jgi:hypothetical protein